MGDSEVGTRSELVSRVPMPVSGDGEGEMRVMVKFKFGVRVGSESSLA